MNKHYLVLLILVLIALTSADEWFTSDSNLISDTQFNSKIVQDKLSFKFVKYFIPHCPYCRHLKTVFDQLKQKKEWCFKIYDFNCQWYPQFCTTNVKSTSFPYTAIHDQNGNLIEQIHGFYPQSIMSTTFERMEQRCLEARASAASKTNQPKTTAETQKSTNPQANMAKSEQSGVKTGLSQQQPKVQFQTKLSQQEKLKMKKGSKSLHLGQFQGKKLNQKIQNAQKKFDKLKHTDHQQSQQKKQAPIQQQKTTSQNSNENAYQSSQQLQMQSQLQAEGKNNDKPEGTISRIYHTYLFYGICLFCAGYYVYSLENTEIHPHSNPEEKLESKQKKTAKHPKQATGEEKEEQKQDPQPSIQQNEQLEHVSDEQL